MGSSRNSDQRSGRRRVVTTRCELLPPSASLQVSFIPSFPNALIPPIRGPKGHEAAWSSERGEFLFVDVTLDDHYGTAKSSITSEDAISTASLHVKLL